MVQFGDTAVSIADLVAARKVEMVPGTRMIYGIALTLKTLPRKEITVWWDRSSGGVSEKVQRDTIYDELMAEWNTA